MNGVTQTRAAQLVVQNEVGLASMVRSQPPVDGLCTRLPSILRCLPGIVQTRGKDLQAGLREKLLETLTRQEPQPARGEDQLSSVLRDRFNQHFSCWRMEQARPELRRRIRCEQEDACDVRSDIYARSVRRFERVYLPRIPLNSSQEGTHGD